MPAASRPADGAASSESDEGGETAVVQARRMERRLDLISAVVLAVAALATAWAAYQSRQWTGEQSTGYSQATTARLTENRSAGLASRQVQIDVATFVQWLDARARHDDELARFYSVRFRPEFQPAFTAWLATDPLDNAKAPPTPFAMPQYRLEAQTEADGLEKIAAAASQHAKDANQHADNSMLAVVLCGTALFFAGISAKLGDSRARIAILGLGSVALIVALIWLATLPVQLTT